MKRRLAVALVLLACLAGVATAARTVLVQERFPHEPHARLFPLCEGCHQGVREGDRAAFYPEPALCARCHDGTSQQRVQWTPPQEQVSNLDFTHPEHDREAGPEIECTACHAPDGSTRMVIRRRAEPEQCIECHAHQASEHLEDAPCAQCHVPLADTQLPLERIAAFAAPRSHADTAFLEGLHGRLAAAQPETCVVCHTRETCASCHVDAGTRAEVNAIPAAGRGLTVPTTRPRYTIPASHRDPDWMVKHGGRARADVQSCATCHTRETCATCHAQQPPAVLAALPVGDSVSAPGVATVRRAPPSHDAPFFDREHGAVASAQPRTCTSCHTRDTCERCHTQPVAASADVPAARGPMIVEDAPVQADAGSSSRYAHQRVAQHADTTRPRQRRVADFHPLNFMSRHASASYGRNLDCQNCHETATFCRACHEQAGMGARGRLQAGFHDAQPNWLFNHGRPARQGLESCASCHGQRDCIQCHSETGAFRVNPHGPGFDAERMMARNPRVCFACHLSDPTRRRLP